VAVLAINKVGPGPYHFRSGPTSGPTTQRQKANISTEMRECVLMAQNFLEFTLMTTTISSTQDTASELNLF